MKKKYASVGLDYDYIISKFPNINDYEEAVIAYLSDPFFKEIEEFIDDEDHAMLKDATKGLFLLAQDLCLIPLYVALLEIFEDVEDEIYDDLSKHYQSMVEVYEKIKGVFIC